MSILVTGHTGFIGSALGKRLDRESLAWVGASLRGGDNLERADSLDRFGPAKWIVHLAGRADIQNSWADPSAFHRTNSLTTLTALEYARRHGAGMLYLSSYMYGIPQYLPVDERHPVSCVNPYAWSKRAGELLCEAYAADFKVPCVLLRPFNIYGPNQSERQLMPYIIAQARASRTISVADLAPKRDWMWVDDLVEAILAVISRPAEGFDVYNVGYGRSFSVSEVIAAVTAQLGEREVVCRNEVRQNEIPDCVCDASRFGRTYGWTPAVTLDAGIKLMLDSEKGGPL